MDSDQDAIYRLVRLPIEFLEKGNVSVDDLIAEYKLLPENKVFRVTAERIKSRLELDHSLVDTWIEWSADKRASSGWYFKKRDDKWEVGYFPNGPMELFSDPINACAEFIFRDLMLARL